MNKPDRAPDSAPHPHTPGQHLMVGIGVVGGSVEQVPIDFQTSERSLIIPLPDLVSAIRNRGANCPSGQLHIWLGEGSEVAEHERPNVPFADGRLEHSPAKRAVIIEGRVSPLTPLRYSLLDLLVRHMDMVVDREEIFERVWGYPYKHGDRSADTLVSKIRKQFGPPFDDPEAGAIRVSPGHGYYASSTLGELTSS